MLTLGGCESCAQRAEHEMAHADAELHRYCQSLSPGKPWSPPLLPRGFRAETSGESWHVVGGGVAVCELKLDAEGKLVSAEFRPD